MSISEQQLETWSHQGSVVQSKLTYETVRDALQSTAAKYPRNSVKIFLQGSYGNSTNIYADSDVDVVILLGSIFYSDTSSLTTAERQHYEQGRQSSTYNFDEFKSDVIMQLVTHFGGSVDVSGDKAIKVHGTGGRRDCDILPAVEHRHCWKYVSGEGFRWHTGICFWDKSGAKIVNYPRQHLKNCTLKHGATSSRFKPTVRIFKNMRNKMIVEQRIMTDLAPSYFIEGMLYNVPTENFMTSRVDTGAACLNWLNQSDRQQLVCANERHYLLRDGSNVCWNTTNFEKYLNETIAYWNGG